MPTKTVTGNPITIYDAVAGQPVSLIANIEYTQSGSGAPSPTNIRPITGFDSVTVNRTGKNILPLIPDLFLRSGTSYTTSETENGTVYTITNTSYSGVTFIITPSIGTVRVVNTGSTAAWHFLITHNGNEPVANYFNNFIKGKTLVFYSGVVSGDTPSTSTARFGIYAGNNFNIKTEGTSKWTVPNQNPNAWNIAISAYASNTGYDITFRPMITILDSPGDAVPAYQWTSFANPQSVTVSLSNAGTVYGGNLNLTTGLLTVTHKFYRFDGSESWLVNQSAPSGLAWFNLPRYLSPVVMTSDLWLCNMYREINNIWTVANTGYSIYKRSDTNYDLCITDTRYPSGTDISVWKSMLAETPLELLYPLATPVTYQLSSLQIALLSGYNNITSNAKTLTIEYNVKTFNVDIPQLFTVSPSNPCAGDTVTLTYSGDIELKTIVAVGIDTMRNVPLTKTGDKTWTFTMPGEDVGVTVGYKPYAEIELNQTTGGVVSANKLIAYEGDVVTLTLTPAENYEPQSVKVTKDARDVTTTKVSDTTYTFAVHIQ